VLVAPRSILRALLLPTTRSNCSASNLRSGSSSSQGQVWPQGWDQRAAAAGPQAASTWCSEGLLQLRAWPVAAEPGAISAMLPAPTMPPHRASAAAGPQRASYTRRPPTRPPPTRSPSAPDARPLATPPKCPPELASAKGPPGLPGRLWRVGPPAHLLNMAVTVPWEPASSRLSSSQ
jgi:hypothetical protein